MNRHLVFRHGRALVGGCALLLVAGNVSGQVAPGPDAPLATGLQAPVPSPAGPSADPRRPALTSPDVRQVPGVNSSAPLTIDQAVAVALANNRSLALAGETLLRAQGRTSETRAAFYPTIGASATVTQLDQGSTASFGQQSITLVKPTQRNFGLQATLPIDISGLLRTATDQARFQEVQARLDINRARNQIVLDVKSSFYDVLRATALLRVAEESLRNANGRLADAEIKFRAGVVARFDVLRAQTDVDSSQQNLIQARNQVSLAFAALHNNMGVSIASRTSITDAGAVTVPPGTPAVLPAYSVPLQSNVREPVPSAAITEPSGPIVASDPLPAGSDYQPLVAEAIGLRPEVMEGDAAIAAAERGIVLARRSTLPLLAITGGAAYAPDNGGFSPRTTSAQAIVSVSIPIFDGGVARARVSQARADVASAETNRRQTLDLVELEVRQAYLTLLQSRDRVGLSNQAVVQAREGYRLAVVRYQAGVSTQAGISPLLELSDAQNALTQAESNQVNALYDYNGARARLDKAVGRYAYVGSGPGYVAPPSPREVGVPKTGRPTR